MGASDPEMPRRTMSRLGWDVSPVGFGAWAIGGSGWGPQSDEDSMGALRRAIELGCNLIDTAQGYGAGHSERLVGQVVRDFPGGGIRVATKIPPVSGNWPPSPYDRAEERYPETYLRNQVEESLRRLGTERIDLLQLHTWTRAWNDDPVPLQVLRDLQREGKIGGIGISTPEQDQNSVVSLMREGWLDAVQVIFNIFEQEPAAELLPVAERTGVGVLVRVPFDEGSLTGKFTADTSFAKGDFRARYFEGDRLSRTVERVTRICGELGIESRELPGVALRFILAAPGVSCVIPGMRNPQQAEMNCGAGTMPPLAPEMVSILRRHYWHRGVWYGGKN